MRRTPHCDDDVDDGGAYVDVHEHRLEPLISGRCHCVVCKLTRDHDHGRKQLPRPLQTQRRRRAFSHAMRTR